MDINREILKNQRVILLALSKLLTPNCKGSMLDIKGEKYIISDIFLRMLKPEELKVMQGFPKDYIIDRDYKWKKYPIAKQVAKIGNSVVPIMAEKLVEANCQYLKVGERMPNLIIEDTQEQLRFA